MREGARPYTEEEIDSLRARTTYTAKHGIGAQFAADTRMLATVDALRAERDEARDMAEAGWHTAGREVARLRAQLAEREGALGEARRAIAFVAEWTNQHGAQLCPGVRADTYGEGMREAKRFVRALLTRHAAATEGGGDA